MNHVLFMSSDPILKEKNIEILKQSGFDVSGTAECLQGLVMLDREEYDIIIIDDELTDVSGFEACLKVRQQADMPIILLGTVTESEVWSKVEELGFDLYIRKPVSPRELLARIKALLRRPAVEKKALPSRSAPEKPLEQVSQVQPPQVDKKTRRAPSATQPATPIRQPNTAPVSERVSIRPQEPSAPPPFEQQIPRQSRQTPPDTVQSAPVQPQVMVPPISVPPVYDEMQSLVQRDPRGKQTQPRATAPHIDLNPQPEFEQPSQMPPVQPTPPSQSQPVTQEYQQPQAVTPQYQPQPVAQEYQQPQAATPRYQQPQPVAQEYQQPQAATPQYQPQPVAVPPMQGKSIPQQAGIQANTTLSRQTPVQPAQVPEETGISILEDARIVKLVDALVSGKLTDITPVVDSNYKQGYAYPAVDGLLDTSEQESVKILEALAKSEILIKQVYERFYVDPDGLFQLVPVEHCPRDDSSNLTKGQLVEHFSCGFVGLDRDFKQESRYVCPKCRKDLRLIGTDYRNIGVHYRCQDCGEVFTTPVIKWRNLKTRQEWNTEELTEMEVYSYRFSPDKKGWLEFQLKPKTQLVDFLRLQSYHVQELVQLKGKSGAVHTMDILATRDDVLTRIDIGIGILVANTGEPEVSLEALFRYDTRAYDIGVAYKVVIAIPKLGSEAINFANRQMIRAFESRTLASVVSDITASPRSKISLQSSLEAGHRPDQGQSATGNTAAIIARFLRNRGYEVYENAMIVGKSGIEHVFDIFARKDDKIVIPTIAIGIGSNPNGQPVDMDQVAMFDAAAFDSGIRNKVFVGLTQITMQARQFAKQQKIDILEQQDLNKLM